MRSDSGQATTEYAGLLALVAAALLGAGALVGLDAVARAVADGVRTGVCIVGGDICRASDAAALGLSPCTVSERTRGGGAVVSIAFLRLGEAGVVTVATRSDGTVLVTRTHERRGGAGVGVGIDASPLGLEVGAEASADLALVGGETFAFRDMAAARRYLDGDQDPPPPLWRFGEVADVLGAQAGAALGPITVGGAEAAAHGVAGARVGRDGTTLYIRARVDAGVKLWAPGAGTVAEGPTTGDVVVELALAGGSPREIAFRRVGEPVGHGRVADTVARLDLRDPENRRAAEALLRRPLPWRTAVAHEVRGVMRLAVERGTVERSVYEVRDETGRLEIAAKLGAELGVDASKVRVWRTLVSAGARTGGSGERAREDCVQGPR